MSWVSGKNIYLGKAYVDWLAVSEWLCSFFKLWEGKNDCLCPYILPLKPNFKRFSPKFIQKWAAKLEKLPKTHRGWLGTAYVTGIPPPTIIEYVKAKWRIFWKIGHSGQISLLKYWGDSDRKTLQNVGKKLEIVPEVLKKRFSDPKLHLDPIWSRFR